MHKEIYESLYKGGKYGNPTLGRCPGVRMYDMYKDHVGDNIIDYGCGNGSTVDHLIKMGHAALGVDQVENPYIVADITNNSIKKYFDPSQFDTALCLDVAEHITDEGLESVFSAMAESKKQVISVNNKSCVKHGVELHINLKSFDEWEALLDRYFDILDYSDYDANTRLYLCEAKAND
jgi:hypothetical protein